jgi:ATP-dependent DNA helicase RecQ
VFRLHRERGQKFGAGQSIDILLGRATEKVAQWSHDSLTTFGIGGELGEAEWRGVVRQLLAQGLLTVEGDYGTLTLADNRVNGIGENKLARYGQQIFDTLAASPAQ